MYNLTIIGAGPGGYHTAIRAAQKGLKVALIEKENVGGVCLNWGCIPTKALFAVAKKMIDFNKLNEFGININNYEFNFKKTQERKQNIIKTIIASVEDLIKKHKIDLIKGTAYFENKKLKVNNEFIETEKVIIATGSSPLELPFFNIDHKTIIDSTDLLNIEEKPESLLILGAGVMGIEFGSIFNAFGSKVTIVELEKQILPTIDKIVAVQLTKILKSRGIDLYLGQKTAKIYTENNKAVFEMEDGMKLTADKALISIGRKYNSNIQGLTETGVTLTQKGAVIVNEFQQTANPDIYAIGDITGEMLLAHVASFHGEKALKHILNEEQSEKQHIPSAIFSIPEIATIGETNQNSDKKLKKGVFYYGGSGKAMALSEEEGMAIVYADENDLIVGATIMGAEASNLIQIITMGMKSKMTVKTFSETIFPHPTLSEIMLEATEDIHGIAIHKYSPPKK